MRLEQKSLLVLLILMVTCGLAYAQTVVWNGQIWDDNGTCALSHPSECISGHWHVVGDDTSVNAPSSANTLVANNIIRTQVFQQAAPASSDSAAAQVSTPKVTRADLFYNAWEANDNDGKTYGINPSFAIGDRHAFTATIPLYITDPDEGEGAKTVGFDGAYRFNWTDTFAIGLHANILGIFDDGDGDDTHTVSVGPYISYLWQMSERVGLSLGALYDYTEPDEGDSISQFVPGANLGFQLNDTWALNFYSMYYALIDMPDDADDGYFDGGAEVSFAKGGWSMSLGLKQTFDLDNYKSTEVYLGSVWLF